MGIRDYGTPESEKRQSVVYGMPWKSVIMSDESLKKTVCMPWESGIIAHQSLKKTECVNVWHATGIMNYGRPEPEKDSV